MQYDPRGPIVEFEGQSLASAFNSPLIEAGWPNITLQWWTQDVTTNVGTWDLQATLDTGPNKVFTTLGLTIAALNNADRSYLAVVSGVACVGYRLVFAAPGGGANGTVKLTSYRSGQ